MALPSTQQLLLGTVLVNATLTMMKIWIGYSHHSQGLLADGLHSASDLLTDAMVWCAVYIGGHRADSNHPYGHERVETLVTSWLAVLLCVVGFGLIYHNLQRDITSEHLLIEGGWLWITVLLSLLAKEVLYHCTKWVAQRQKSALLMANAWHHRSDAASSLVVLLGLLLSQMGLAWGDALAAMVVGSVIVVMGCRLGWRAIQELIDTAVEPDTVQQIRQCITSVPGVWSVHDLRTRTMGSKILIDAHILVSPRITVSEGHHISHQVRIHLEDLLEQVDVVVHVDPENDQHFTKTKDLLTREALLSKLRAHWQHLPAYDAIEQIDLHYLNGQIEIILMLRYEAAPEHLARLQQCYQAGASDLDGVRSVRLCFVMCES